MQALNRALAKSRVSDGIAAKTRSDPNSLDQQAQQRRSLLRWRRVTLRSTVVVSATCQQDVLEAFETTRTRQIDEAKQVLVEAGIKTIEKKVRVKGEKEPSGAVMPMAKGKALPPSILTKGRILPTDCPRDESRVIARGGLNLWMTCLDCGSRWERLPGVEGAQRSSATEVDTDYAKKFDAPSCRCDLKMKLRTNSLDDSMFWGCANWRSRQQPGCRLTRQFATSAPPWEAHPADCDCRECSVARGTEDAAMNPQSDAESFEEVTLPSHWPPQGTAEEDLLDTDEIYATYRDRMADGAEHSEVVQYMMQCARNKNQQRQIFELTRFYQLQGGLGPEGAEPSALKRSPSSAAHSYF